MKKSMTKMERIYSSYYSPPIEGEIIKSVPMTPNAIVRINLVSDIIEKCAGLE